LKTDCEPDSTTSIPYHLTQPAKKEAPSKVYITPPSFSSMTPTELPSTHFSSTQETIASVKNDIESLRNSFPPQTMSSRQQVVLSMGEEVRELKKEVQYLVKALQNSMRHKQILQRKLDYFEQKEEDELIKMSLEDDQREDKNRNRHHYSQPSTALTSFSRKYNFSPNFNH